MKYSESWLREWVNPSIDREQLTHQITMAGLEVDDVIPVAGEFSGVVVGEVVECSQHPDADKLRVTKVDVGQDELLDIVCGAANCRQGLKVAVATIGAVLPGDFTIKKTKLRGQPSNGMLCSFSELGIDIESNGIMELPPQTQVGQDFRDFLQLNDVTIDVDLTTNRADCLSIKGLAREVGLLNRLAISAPSINSIAPSIDDVMSVAVDVPAACPRYLARVINNIDISVQTPLWMQEKLRRCGVRSIDPVVDVTNFVMLEQGQPMHAFDKAKIDGGIVVRMAREGEKLTLLSGAEASLQSNTLVIADSNKPLAIAGIFGGLDSGVTANTKDIVLESAFFAPDAIRGRARNYGLHTDSSHRFERGVDSELAMSAMERASALLLEICGGEAGEIVHCASEADLPKANDISLRRAKLDALLGCHISDADVTDILTCLGGAVSTTTDGWAMRTPSWRFDLAIEQDLIEEVGRVFGYDNIPNKVPHAALSMNQQNEKKIPLKRVRDLLVDRGFNEVITYSFVEPKQLRAVVPDSEPLILPNPISNDMSAMRLSLIPGLLNTLAYNQKRQQPNARIFESGLRFIPDETAENGIRQEMMLALAITGNKADEHWNNTTDKVDFFTLKADIEALLALTAKPRDFHFVAAKHPAMHPGQTAAIMLDGNVIGHIGTVHPLIEREFSLASRTIVCEIEWQAIDTRVIPEAVRLSKFPANRRDIAVIVDEAIASDAIVHACLTTTNQLITDASLFDLYQGKGIDEGKKSLAIALGLQSAERTLEENDISDAVAQVIELLKNKFNAQLRD